MILITGGAGFIGSCLIDRLLESNVPVVALDNFDPFYSRTTKQQNLVHALESPQFSLVEGDIRDINLLNQTFKRFRPQTVIHLAAKAGVHPSIRDADGYADVNVTGTARVLNACHRWGVSRVVFGSSSSVYGKSTRAPFREDSRADHPLSPYAATKKAGEEIAYALHHVNGVNVVCLRFFTVYGPRQRPEMAIHKFTRLILNGQKVPIFGGGDSSRDYTYIDDIIDGIISAIDRPLKGWCVYNLGGSSTTSLNELVQIIEKALGKKAKTEYLAPRPGDVPITYADLTQAQNDLGYRPKVSLREGVTRFVRWFLAQKDKHRIAQS